VGRIQQYRKSSSDLYPNQSESEFFIGENSFTTGIIKALDKVTKDLIMEMKGGGELWREIYLGLTAKGDD
jgi:hypothetical protein